MAIPDVHHQLIWTGYLVVSYNTYMHCMYVTYAIIIQLIYQTAKPYLVPGYQIPLQGRNFVHLHSQIFSNYSHSQEDDEQPSIVPWT